MQNLFSGLYIQFLSLLFGLKQNVLLNNKFTTRSTTLPDASLQVNYYKHDTYSLYPLLI